MDTKLDWNKYGREQAQRREPLLRRIRFANDAGEIDAIHNDAKADDMDKDWLVAQALDLRRRTIAFGELVTKRATELRDDWRTGPTRSF